MTMKKKKCTKVATGMDSNTKLAGCGIILLSILAILVCVEFAMIETVDRRP